MELSYSALDWKKIEIVTFRPYRKFSFFIYFEGSGKCLLLNACV
jgi:hypothetical protein